MRLRLLALVAIIMLIPATAIAHGEHEHADTLERLLDAGMSEEEAVIIAEHFDELDALQDDYYGGHDHGEGFWAESWELLTDPAHWSTEVAAEILFFGFNIFIIERLIHSHRRGQHTLDGDK